MAFRTISLLLMLLVCLHFTTGTVAFKDLSGLFTDFHQILVMEVMWDTCFYASGFVFRKEYCCNILSRKMWVHWGDWLGAMEKNHRLQNHRERSSLQQGSNHVSKETLFPSNFFECAVLPKIYESIGFWVKLPKNLKGSLIHCRLKVVV